MISWKAVILLALVAASVADKVADKPTPLYKKETTAPSSNKEAIASSAEKTNTKAAKTPKAEERQDQYGAPAIEQYGAPAIEQYGAPAAPAAETYGAPAAPAQDTYGSPSAPVAETYGAPAAPAYSAPAAPSEVGTQGYYYYYPVSTSPVQAKPSYAPPRQGFAGGNNALANIGLPIGVIIIVGIGIAIGIAILIAVASTTTTTTTGRSLVNYFTDNMDDVTQLVFQGIQFYQQLNSRK